MKSNTEEPIRCNKVLLIYKISSTCFGRSFDHHQEHILLRCRSPSPCPPQQKDTICCKNLSLTLLMMGKRLPGTCWAYLIDQ